MALQNFSTYKKKITQLDAETHEIIEKILQHFEAELYPHGNIQVLISSLTRDLPPQIFGYYSKLLKGINSSRLPEIDF